MKKETVVSPKRGFVRGNSWKKAEFLFCFVVIWAAAICQGYALFQEWREEKTVIDAFKVLGVTEIESWNDRGENAFTYIGSRPGRLTLDERGDMEDRLFHSLNAQVVEAVREEELYTVYGLSSLFREPVCYGENEINLNLAFAYDEIEKETRVYLAVPYIQMDY